MTGDQPVASFIDYYNKTCLSMDVLFVIYCYLYSLAYGFSVRTLRNKVGFSLPLPVLCHTESSSRTHFAINQLHTFYLFTYIFWPNWPSAG
jgi:hypothetical protein